MARLVDGTGTLPFQSAPRPPSCQASATHSPELAERLMTAQGIATEAEMCDKAVDGLRPAFYAESVHVSQPGPLT